jgi:hypothetical protein
MSSALFEQLDVKWELLQQYLLDWLVSQEWL